MPAAKSLSKKVPNFCVDEIADGLARDDIKLIRRHWLGLAWLYLNGASDHPDSWLRTGLLYLSCCRLFGDQALMTARACRQLSEFVPWPYSREWTSQHCYADGARWVSRMVVRESLDDALYAEEAVDFTLTQTDLHELVFDHAACWLSFMPHGARGFASLSLDRALELISEGQSVSRENWRARSCADRKSGEGIAK